MNSNKINNIRNFYRVLVAADFVILILFSSVIDIALSLRKLLVYLINKFKISFFLRL